MTYTYTLDLEVKDEWEEKSTKIRSDGTVRFTRSGRSEYAGSGRVMYELSSESMLKAGDYFIGGDERGKGDAPVDDSSVLEFSSYLGTYTFTVVPGGEEGVAVDWSRKSNLSSKMGEELSDVLVSPGALETVAPYDEEDEGWSSFAVRAVGVPIPSFGTVLSGSTTDNEGGVVSWRLEPLEPRPDTNNELQEFPFTESGAHYHAPDPHGRWQATCLELESSAQDLRKSTSPAVAFPQRTPSSIFLVSESGSHSGIQLSCGDSLVAVPIPSADNANAKGPSRPTSTTLLQAAQISVRETEAADSSDSASQIQALLNALFIEELVGVPPDLVNPVQAYPLFLEAVTLEGSAAVVRLAGAFTERAPCDRDRIKGQINQTVRQFETVSDVRILLDDQSF
ncbi:MAG: hypothetical protein RQ826_10820 [Xanthomonadales bacterium]|nr:hypothetical protein [Xanthomonadales bacterium]